VAHVRPGHSPRILQHRGLDYRRTRFCPREHAFSETWERENKPAVGRGIGSWGTLRALCCFILQEQAHHG
jgi:hypothetical protein